MLVVDGEKKHPEEVKRIQEENGKKLQQWRIDHPEEYYEKAIIPFMQGSKKMARRASRRSKANDY